MTTNLVLRKTTTVIKAKVKVEVSLEKVWSGNVLTAKNMRMRTAIQNIEITSRLYVLFHQILNTNSFKDPKFKKNKDPINIYNDY